MPAMEFERCRSFSAAGYKPRGRTIRRELRKKSLVRCRQLDQSVSGVPPPVQECSTTRRAALALPLAATAAAAAAAGMANPARAMIQTGQERDSLRQSRSAVERLEDRVSTFQLGNGMKWIVLERHNAPIVACHTYADVGAADESSGVTGIAHLLEHLAFKGTRLIGSRDFEREAQALDRLDEVFYALRDAKAENNPKLVGKLAEEFAKAQEQAAKLSAASQYGSLIERQGGVGLNAQTSQDSTEYFVSLPANKLELWMALESGRFTAPVFRDLYSEKEVVKEERRLRVDNSPYGRFTEAFTEAAFPGQAYGRPVIGYPSDFERIGRREVIDFFRKNYTPCKLTCAVVGDVNPVEVEKLATCYFGGWTTPCSTSSSSQGTYSELWRKRDGWDDSAASRPSLGDPLKVVSPAQPLYMEGYYRPASWSSDDPVMSVISDLLAGGRVSRFYRKLIAPSKVLSAECISSFPGDKYPCLMMLYASPTPGSRGTEQVAGLVHDQLQDLVLRGIQESELVPIRKSTRASLLEALGSNSSMARILSTYEATAGSWTRVLEETREIESVTADDVVRVASKIFNPSNRIAGSTPKARFHGCRRYCHGGFKIRMEALAASLGRHRCAAMWLDYSLCRMEWKFSYDPATDTAIVVTHRIVGDRGSCADALADLIRKHEGFVSGKFQDCAAHAFKEMKSILKEDLLLCISAAVVLIRGDLVTVIAGYDYEIHHVSGSRVTMLSTTDFVPIPPQPFEEIGHMARLRLEPGKSFLFMRDRYPYAAPLSKCFEILGKASETVDLLGVCGKALAPGSAYFHEESYSEAPMCLTMEINVPATPDGTLESED